MALHGSQSWFLHARTCSVRCLVRFVMFSYVVRTYVVHFLWAGGWSGLGPGGGKNNSEWPKTLVIGPTNSEWPQHSEWPTHSVEKVVNKIVSGPNK